MAGMDLFKNPAFGMTTLTATVEKLDYIPQTLGSLNIFTPVPTRTRSVFVDRRSGGLTLIPTSALGAPPVELQVDLRDAVPLQTTRIAKGFTIYAHEIDGIRAFGSQTELSQLQAEYLTRMSRIRNDMDLTHEYHRLGALQGLLLDADGVTVIYDFYEEFGIARPDILEVDLDDPTFDVRMWCHMVAREMLRGSGGAITSVSQIHALAGDAFYDKLVSHPKVERTYENWSAAVDLRGNSAFSAFTFGGIVWHNYRGTDDNSTVAIAPDEAHFFPTNAPGVFQKAMAPAEFGPFIGTPGQDVYAMNILDRDRQAWSRGELYSYPLYMCARPDVLRRARLAQ